jgi:ADP-heptose:LPS heptosyltransferase
VLHDWVGRLTLPELAALLAMCDLYVGGDSGPLKMAEAVGARSVSFWGPTSATFLGPRGPHHRTLPFEASPDEAAAAAMALLA